MAHYIILWKPTPSTEGCFKSAISRFNRITQKNLSLKAVKNLSREASLIESNRTAMVFCEQDIEPQDLNTFLACYLKAKEKPRLITTKKNLAVIREKLASGDIVETSYEFTAEFVFSCLKSFLTPRDQGLDIRYIKSIVTYAADVIRQNTGIMLSAESIHQVKAKSMKSELFAMAGFHGDGSMGTITISTSEKLLTLMTRKILRKKAEDTVAADDLMDTLAELSSQILGNIRRGLSEHGYRLKTTLNMVARGAPVYHSASNTGQYFALPFDYYGEKFTLTFCYNTYHTRIQQTRIHHTGYYQPLMDVRLLEAAHLAFNEIVQSQVQQSVKRSQDKILASQCQETKHLFIFHCAGIKADFSMMLEVDDHLIDMFGKATMGMGAADFDNEMTHDTFGEMINQVGGFFLKIADRCGYNLQRIFHGGFSGDSLRYLIRNRGQFIRFTLDIAGTEVQLICGMSGDQAEQFFNIWPYFVAMSQQQDGPIKLISVA